MKRPPLEQITTRLTKAQAIALEALATHHAQFACVPRMGDNDPQQVLIVNPPVEDHAGLLAAGFETAVHAGIRCFSACLR